MFGSKSKHLRCSFCGKSADEVRHLIAGPDVYICDACVGLCVEILAEQQPPGVEPHAPHSNGRKPGDSGHDVS